MPKIEHTINSSLWVNYEYGYYHITRYVDGHQNLIGTLVLYPEDIVALAKMVEDNGHARNTQV